eukprot:29571-Prymnesium_polylepis.1
MTHTSCQHVHSLHHDSHPSRPAGGALLLVCVPARAARPASALWPMTTLPMPPVRSKSAAAGEQSRSSARARSVRVIAREGGAAATFCRALF